MNECAVQELESATCAALHRGGPYGGIGAAIDALLGRVAREGLTPAGAPQVVYLSDPGEGPEADASWEVRVPVAGEPAETTPDGDGFAIRRVPALLVAATTHRGSRESVGDGRDRLDAWIEAHGLEVSGELREVYLDDPAAAAPADQLTEIMIPVYERP